MNAGIYKITNTITGKVYIGASVDIETRWYQHRQSLANTAHKNNDLQADYITYGASAFEYAALEIIKDVNRLTSRERYWMKQFSALYNVKNKLLAKDFFENQESRIHNRLKRIRKQHPLTQTARDH